MNRNIEPDCLAVVKNGVHAGEVTRVISKVKSDIISGGILIKSSKNVWGVDKLFTWKPKNAQGPKVMLPYQIEDRLMRIYGHTEDADAAISNLYEKIE